ncbi:MULTISPECIES: YfdX family protein [Thiorhodovibrio]|uniref:YfdX family protein n=1 Tax=Thiorhodovibrio TaxID=61593 RepID=UPI0019131B4E|nr:MULTISPECIES: YfdX family protein [Thiorhodovibrio]WPL14807.1 YfdX protein [Thiorhodovibrio litoralis]
MQTSKRILLTGVLALSVAGGAVGQLLAATNPDSKSTQSSQGAQDAARVSEHGMTAMSDIQLARLAINDGYTDQAGELLTKARTLLDQVEEENPPVTVSTEVKVGDEPAQKQSVTGKPNMIPILSEIGVIEAVVAEKTGADPASTKGNAKQTDAAKTDKSAADQSASDSSSVSKAQQSAAIAEAKTQLQQGDAKAAVETLKPVELALVARVVTMPLKETSKHLDEARDQLEQSKFHEANLSLKAIEDGLVVATKSVIEPVAAMTPDGKAGNDGKSGT